MSILSDIVDANSAELSKAKQEIPAKNLLGEIALMPPAPSFKQALLAKADARRPAVIAELKRASPSKGFIRNDLDCAELARELAAAGAAALSVLTEPHFFHGSLDNLRIARENCSIPLLRKDFIVDEYQLLQARAAGASAILLIAALLDDAQLADLTAAAHALGLEVLAEAHTAAETERLLAIPADMIGLNARDLHTFQTSLEVVKQLVQRIPRERNPVAESAIQTHDDLVELHAAGAVGFLIGETLMRAPDPARKLREMLEN